MTKWIVIEGGEGTGKSTLIKSLNEELSSRGLKVLVTKEPGSPLCPVTMELRNIMLNAEYEPQMTIIGRELISQAIRSIHIAYIRKVKDQYDVILQDRGIMSGFAYGKACGVPEETLEHMAQKVTGSNKRLPNIIGELYDYTLFLECDPKIGLERAGMAKKEFEAGDAMELKGLAFHNKVKENFADMMYSAIEFRKGIGNTINVENMKCENVLTEAMKCIMEVIEPRKKK